MSTHPQDVEQIRQLSTQLTVRAAALEEEVSQITTALRAVNWTGPGADGFKADWMNSHLPNVQAAINAMRTAAQAAADHAAKHAQAGPTR